MSMGPGSTTNQPGNMWLQLLTGLVATLVGIVLIVAPGLAVVTGVQILGVFWLVAGVAALVEAFARRTETSPALLVVLGIVGIIVGLFSLFNPVAVGYLTASVAVITAGALAIAYGIVAMVHAFQGGGWAPALLGALSILVGLAFVFNPVYAGLGLVVIAGIIALVGGVATMIAAIFVRPRAPAV
ncbi:MAG: HdeD family acid-resistance protein [Chloroflexota bacterium]